MLTPPCLDLERPRFNQKSGIWLILVILDDDALIAVRSASASANCIDTAGLMLSFELCGGFNKVCRFLFIMQIFAIIITVIAMEIINKP